MRDYRSEQRIYKVGCGELRVRIAYKGDESFHFILIDLLNPDSEINPCCCAYTEALANNLTMLLRRIDIGKEVSAVVKNLTKQRCKYGIKSCPDAIGQAIEEAFKERTKDK
jgi:hypothetical protein